MYFIWWVLEDFSEEIRFELTAKDEEDMITRVSQGETGCLGGEI